MVGIGTGLTVLLFVPTNYERIVSEGTDTFEAHRPIFGEHEITFPVLFSEPVLGIGLVIVDLRHSGNLVPVEVSVRDRAGSVYRATIEPNQIQDDQFAYVYFDSPIDTAEEVTVSIMAPEAKSKEALGVRFDIGSNGPALLLVEQVQGYQQLSLWSEAHPERFKRIKWVGMGGAVLAGLLLWSSKIGRVWWWDPFTWSLVGLAAVTIWLRFGVALKIESAFGGDAFNYLLQSKAWLQGDNPFGIEWRRKAPLLSLLLMPAYLPGIDPLWWSRVVNMGLAAITVVMVVLLLRRWGVPRSLALGGGFLLAVNRLYWFETVHGLANPLHGFLIVAAVYGLTFYRLRIGRWWVAVAASLATLARWEALLVVGVLVSSIWSLERWRLSTLLHMLVPVTLLLLIPLVMWPITGEVGVRPPSDLAADGGLYLAYSVEDFKSNWRQFKLLLGRQWLLVPEVGSPGRWLVLGSIIGMVLPGVRRKLGRVTGWLSQFAIVLFIALIFYALINDTRELDRLLVAVLSMMTGVGAGLLLVRRPRLAVPVLLLIGLELIAVTAILPKPRYYLWLIPWLTVGITVSIWWLSRGQRAYMRMVAVSALSFLIMFVYIQSIDARSGYISDYNEKSHDHTVVLRAVKWARGVDGMVAVVAESDLPVRVYLSDDRYSVMPKQLIEIEEIIRWIETNNVNYIIETSAQPAFGQTIVEYPDRYIEVASFSTRFAETTAWIYQVLPQDLAQK